MTASRSPVTRVAAIDFGTVRIGLAISDSRREFASPLCIYQRRDLAADGMFFVDLAKREQIGQWVVGLPVHLDGRESGKSRQAREFAEWLAKTTNVPVDLFDERYTTVEAESMLMDAGFTKKRRKERLDKV